MNSLEPGIAERVLGQIQTQVQKTPFSFLQRAESENLLTFIQDEHPQTIALITLSPPHHKAARSSSGCRCRSNWRSSSASPTWSRPTPR
jgi:flagellar motor switch protein FliG